MKMTMRKICSLILACVLTLSLVVIPFGGAAGAGKLDNALLLYMNKPNVLVQGVKGYITNNATPVWQNGTAMVPAEFFFETMGATYSYNSSTGAVTIAKGGTTLSMVTGSKTLTNGSSSVTLPVAPNVVNNTVYVPAEILCEQLGLFYFLESNLMVCNETDISLSWANDLELLRTTCESFIYDSVTGAQIVAAVEAEHPGNGHPRLIMTADKFSALSQEFLDADGDAVIKQILTQMTTACNTLVNTDTTPIPKTMDANNVRMEASVQEKRILQLAFMYNIYKTSNSTLANQYAARAWTEINSLCNYTDWNPYHFLDCGTVTSTVALAYDWLYSYLSDSQKQTMRNAILTKGIGEFMNDYNGLTMGSSNGTAHNTGAGTRYRTWLWDKSETVNNWRFVGAGGIATGALAICDELSGAELTNAQIAMEYSLELIRPAISLFAPNGAYPEGILYWDYAGRYYIKHIGSLLSATGDDYGYFDAPGLSTTNDYIYSVTGTASKWAYHDAEGTSASAVTSVATCWAGLFNDYDIMPHRIRNIQQGNGNYIDLFYYDTDMTTAVPSAEALDTFMKTDGLFTARSGAGNNDTWVGLHADGGVGVVDHGHADAGSFVMDAMGESFFFDLGRDNYDLPNYARDCYRTRAEGHNGLVINPGDGQYNGYDMASDGVATLESHVSKPYGAYAIANVTDSWREDVTSARRGVKLDNSRRTVTVQDEVTFKEASDVYWFAHTKANITLTNNNKTALLTLNGKTLKAEIAHGDGATFSILDAVPSLPGSPTVTGQNANTGIRKLAIHVSGCTQLNLMVVFNPCTDANGTVAYDYNTTWTSLSDWTVSVSANPLEDFVDRTVSFDGTPEPVLGTDYYVNNISDTTKANAVVASDPDGSANKVLKVTNPGGANPWFGLFNSPTPYNATPFEVSFDFRVDNNWSNHMFGLWGKDAEGKTVSDNLLVFNMNGSNSGVVYGDGTGANGGILGPKWVKNTWYTATVSVNLAEDYLELTVKQRGDLAGTTAEKVRVTKLASLRKFASITHWHITLSTKTTAYFDNLSQKVLETDDLIPNATDKAALEFDGPFNEFNNTVYTMYSDSYALRNGENARNERDNDHLSASNLGAGTLSPVVENGIPALKISKPATKLNLAVNMAYNAAAMTKMDFAYTMKVSNATGSFGFYLRDNTSGADASIVSYDANSIYFMGNKICAMEYGTWYDYQISIDTDLKYAELKLRKTATGENEATAWETYNAPYNQLKKYNTTTLMDLSSVKGVLFGWYDHQNGQSPAAQIYLTNYMQNTRSTALVPSLQSLSDDLTTLPTSTTEVLGNQTGWAVQNIAPMVSGKTTTMTLAEDGAGFVLTNVTAKAYPNFYMTPFFSAPDVRHRVRFTMSVPDTSACHEFWVYGSTDATGTAKNSTLMSAIKMAWSGGLYIECFGEKIATNLQYNPRTMLDCELIYDAAEKEIIVSVMGPNGAQYVSDDTTAQSYVTGILGESWTPLSMIQVRLTLDAGDVMYFDNFTWDILDTTLNVNGTFSSAAFGFETASRDDDVVFNFGETVDYSSINNATVSVTQNGSPVTMAHTVTAKGEDVIIDFATEFTPGATYTVSLNGITTLQGLTQSAAATTEAFTVTTDAVSATTGVSVDGMYRIPITSGYNKKPVTLLAALYDDNGVYVEHNSTQTTATRGTKNYYVSTTFTKPGETVKAFVWDSVSNVKPYSAALTNVPFKVIQPAE
ncbi:MAG: hypothetical protein E7402_03760 [Ruminococcaceae bacterium]|nr:hypothetical protein [Oscillospiraceae bacterium]